MVEEIRGDEMAAFSGPDPEYYERESRKQGMRRWRQDVDRDETQDRTEDEDENEKENSIFGRELLRS